MPSPKFAGGKILGIALGPVAAAFDVASLTSQDKDGIAQARQLAQEFAQTGMSYEQIMKQVQNDPQLESAIGDIGWSDRAKTAAGTLLQAGDLIAGPLGLVTGGLGVAAQFDLQGKKARRSQAFKEELDRIYAGGSM